MWFGRICLVLLPFIVASGSHVKIHFPLSSPDTHPRLRLTEEIPTLSEFTLCTWIKPYLFQERLTIFFSYTSDRFYREYIGFFFNQPNITTIDFVVANKFTSFECPHLNFQVGEWYHICNTWFSSSGHLRAYVNGKQCFPLPGPDQLIIDQTRVVSKGDSIKSGGVFVIGQYQRGSDQYSDKENWFHGDITDFNLWNEAFTEEQIRERAKCYNMEKLGNVIGFLDTPMIAIHVNISKTEFCSRQIEYNSLA